jgi:hypothetical protein
MVGKGICTHRFLLKCADDLGLVVPGSVIARMKLEPMRELRMHPAVQNLVLKVDLPDDVIKAQIQVTGTVCVHVVCVRAIRKITYIHMHVEAQIHTYTHTCMHIKIMQNK